MKKNILSLLVLTLLAQGAHAKVSTQQARQLGKNLTAIGAQIDANKSGTIPAYTGGLAQDINTDPYSNIYAEEAPLFTITKANLEQYKDNLTPGQIAMFERYPDTYKMPIFTTHRSASLPKSIKEKAKKNATSTNLLANGNGLTNFDESIPFAIPQNGLEVIWNHVTRFRGGSVQLNRATIPVQRDGSFTPIRISAKFSPPQYLKEGFDSKEDENVLFYYSSAIKSPARLTGNVLLVHETIDQINEPRKAWQYNAGQRRVRRAPQIAYDSPNTEGLRTSDQVDMFNGAPDRYNWKLIGKKEMYIPYNSYKIMDKNAKYEDIIGAGHINQDYTRYELHRVWQVEATIKEGSRHIYAKRSLYLDEDSWQISVADHYDQRGQLWRVAEGHAMQFINVDTPWYTSITNYDLISGRYMVELNIEERNAFDFKQELKRKDFTTAAIRRSGKR
ncbi:MAG: DUF1329 domain-containing protein [Bermanella sp.]